MINTEDFTKRLRNIMEYYGESASSFAEKIGVQRSSISHILSGRNKPSLDFILKVLSSFPEVDLYWLFNGRGNFPSENKNEIADKEVKTSTSQNSIIENLKVKNSNGKTIERIVIFYSDGTFKNFQN
ncbi:helix-turn-helix domain-containing protein [Flavisericum labens]|uniref:helix-turn-helix domain-containing protein n=1 Tax=Flavisericum labens TaxID=3377112 RepID=UPI00387AA916